LRGIENEIYNFSRRCWNEAVSIIKEELSKAIFENRRREIVILKDC